MDTGISRSDAGDPVQGNNERLSAEPDPHEVLQPFPSEAMGMWPISTKVNSPLR